MSDRVPSTAAIPTNDDLGYDCQMCTGEYCAVHITAPCDCDGAERHGDQPCYPAWHDEQPQ